MVRFSTKSSLGRSHRTRRFLDLLIVPSLAKHIVKLIALAFLCAGANSSSAADPSPKKFGSTPTIERAPNIDVDDRPDLHSVRPVRDHYLIDLNKITGQKYTDAFSTLSLERRWAIDEGQNLRQEELRLSSQAQQAPLPVPTLSEQDYEVRLSEIDAKTRADERAEADSKLEERQRFSAGLELVDLTRQRARLDLQLEESRAFAKADAVYDTNVVGLANVRKDIELVDHYLYSIDDVISGMLTTTEKENNFRLTIAGVFAGLVALLIGGFFVIARKNDSVRESFLSNDRGLQFVTLFSLVIAIILFGVMNILEGRELSALLGGLSGYILGRTNFGGGGPEHKPERTVDS